MSESEVIVEPEILDVVPYVGPPAVANLFGEDSPKDVVRRASEHADALADVIKKKSLYKNIQGKSHVLVEGWTLLGAMVGVFPVVVWTKPLNEGGWEARVEARTLGGQIVGAAEAQCSRDENAWGFEPKGRDGKKLQPRDDYALRSMAQTRATSKALRGPLGFIVQLAGYNPTPAEEIPDALSEDATGVLGSRPRAAVQREPVSGSPGRADEPPHTPASSESAPGPKITGPQMKKLNAVLGELKAKEDPVPPPHETWEDYARAFAGVESRAHLTKKQAGELITHLEAMRVPF
jgi:hypothetical protein